MDGSPVILPGDTLKSLVRVRSQLELIALRQSRVLSALRVDGAEVDLSQAGEERPFHSIQAHTISLETLRGQIARTALRQAESIHARAVSLASLVLINEWSVSFKQAQRVASDLRTLAALLGFFRDVSPDALAIQGADHMVRGRCKARILLIHWSTLEIEKDNIALSDWLEYSVAPWSNSVATTLQKMN